MYPRRFTDQPRGYLDEVSDIHVSISDGSSPRGDGKRGTGANER